jgi:hypothetical protein
VSSGRASAVGEKPRPAGRRPPTLGGRERWLLNVMCGTRKTVGLTPNMRDEVPYHQKKLDQNKLVGKNRQFI